MIALLQVTGPTRMNLVGVPNHVAQSLATSRSKELHVASSAEHTPVYNVTSMPPGTAFGINLYRFERRLCGPLISALRQDHTYTRNKT